MTDRRLWKAAWDQAAISLALTGAPGVSWVASRSADGGAGLAQGLAAPAVLRAMGR